MNGLVAHYHESNVASGHDYNCAYAAGGDCCCSRIDREANELRAVYRQLRATVLNLTPHLPGTTFPKNVASFDARMTLMVETDWRERDCYPDNDAETGADYVHAARALLDSVEHYIDEARDLRADYALETF